MVVSRELAISMGRRKASAKEDGWQKVEYETNIFMRVKLNTQVVNVEEKEKNQGDTWPYPLSWCH